MLRDITIGLDSPWDLYAKKLQALFNVDHDIRVDDVVFDDGDYSIPITVYNHEKYIALDRVLEKKVTFGNVEVSIDLYDAENEMDNQYFDAFATIFAGNPLVQDIIQAKDRAGTDWEFIRFKPEVVQYFADNVGNPDGLITDLAEHIADEVFQDNVGFFFTTAPVQPTDEKITVKHTF